MLILFLIAFYLLPNVKILNFHISKFCTKKAVDKLKLLPTAFFLLTANFLISGLFFPAMDQLMDLYHGISGKFPFLHQIQILQVTRGIWLPVQD